MKDGSARSRVGAGWRLEGGGISLALDPGCVIDWRLAREATIVLFPRDREETT